MCLKREMPCILARIIVSEEGKLLMCGEGENGKLGLSRENRNVFVPTPVNINVPIRSVACGGNHTIAVSSKRRHYPKQVL